MFSGASKSGCDLRGDIELFVLAIEKNILSQFEIEQMRPQEQSGSRLNGEGNITCLSRLTHLCWA